MIARTFEWFPTQLGDPCRPGKATLSHGPVQEVRGQQQATKSGPSSCQGPRSARHGCCLVEVPRRQQPELLAVQQYLPPLAFHGHSEECVTHSKNRARHKGFPQQLPKVRRLSEVPLPRFTHSTGPNFPFHQNQASVRLRKVYDCLHVPSALHWMTTSDCAGMRMQHGDFMCRLRSSSRQPRSC